MVIVGYRYRFRCEKHPLLKELRERAIRMVREYKVQWLTDAEILEALHDFGFTSAVEYALQGN